MKNYYGTYLLNNGQILTVYEEGNKLVDGNGIEITEAELKEYRKIN